MWNWRSISNLQVFKTLNFKKGAETKYTLSDGSIKTLRNDQIATADSYPELVARGAFTQVDTSTSLGISIPAGAVITEIIFGIDTACSGASQACSVGFTAVLPIDLILACPLGTDAGVIYPTGNEAGAADNWDTVTGGLLYYQFPNAGTGDGWISVKYYVP
jgi:hypothetical protein